MDNNEEPAMENKRTWILALLPVAACVMGAILGWSIWLPFGAIAVGATAFVIARWPRASEELLPEPSEELDCETRFECQALLLQLDRFSRLPAVASGPDAAFYRMHVDRLRRIALDLARDRALIRRLSATIDEHALRYTSERLKQLAERSGDPEAAAMYQRACEIRDRQLDMLARLREVAAVGNAHWEHLSAVVEELVAETTVKELYNRVQSQDDALRQLATDATAYRSAVRELGESTTSGYTKGLPSAETSLHD